MGENARQAEIHCFETNEGFSLVSTSDELLLKKACVAVLRGILAWRNLNCWNSSLVEMSYTKFLNSAASGRERAGCYKKKIIWPELVSIGMDKKEKNWLELISARDEFH